jgi:hypothetical protein
MPTQGVSRGSRSRHRFTFGRAQRNIQRMTKKPTTSTPGEVVLAELGLGPAVAGLRAEFPSISRSTVWRWGQPRNAGGTGGLIPPRYHVPLLRLAKNTGRTLTTNDLVYGRSK